MFGFLCVLFPMKLEGGTWINTTPKIPWDQRIGHNWTAEMNWTELKIPWRRDWLPTPVFLLGESHGQRSLGCYSPWGCKESDTTEQLTFSCRIWPAWSRQLSAQVVWHELDHKGRQQRNKNVLHYFVDIFSHNLASTITLNLCLHLVYLRPMLSSVHINQCCSQMMTKDSQFSYSTPIAFRDLSDPYFLTSRLPIF